MRMRRSRPNGWTQKGPEAVVIDTSRPIIVPTPTAQEDAAKNMPPDTQVAENTARLASPSDAKELSKVDPRPQPRSNVGKARTKRPPVSYAQRPDVGAYGPWTLDQQDARIRDSFAQLVPTFLGS